MYVCTTENGQKVAVFLLDIKQNLLVPNYTANQKVDSQWQQNPKRLLVQEQKRKVSQCPFGPFGPTSITAPVSVNDIMDRLLGFDIEGSLDFNQGQAIWKLRQPEKIPNLRNIQSGLKTKIIVEIYRQNQWHSRVKSFPSQKNPTAKHQWKEFFQSYSEKKSNEDALLIE